MVQEAVHVWLSKQTITFYFDAFENTVQWWAQSMENQGETVEKYHICNVQKINKKYLGKTVKTFQIPLTVSCRTLFVSFYTCLYFTCLTTHTVVSFAEYGWYTKNDDFMLGSITMLNSPHMTSFICSCQQSKPQTLQKQVLHSKNNKLPVQLKLINCCQITELQRLCVR
jgi:hypothetical protein